MKQYHIISRIAIYLLAVILIVYGFLLIDKPHNVVLYYPVSLPGGVVWTYIVGFAFIIVGLSFIFNKWVKFTGYLLAALLLVFMVPVHLSNSIHASNGEDKMLAFIDFLKDTAIACFALHVAAGAHHQHLHLEESD